MIFIIILSVINETTMAILDQPYIKRLTAPCVLQVLVSLYCSINVLVNFWKGP